MAKQSKITVKHYLNDKLKANGFTERKKFPIYVRVSFLRKNFRFRSTFLKWYYSDIDFEDIDNLKAMQYETEIINFIVTKNEDIQDLSDYLYLLKYDIIHIVKQNILTGRVFENLNFYEKITIEINNLISSKTKINIDAISYISKIDNEINNNFFTLIDENLLTNSDLKRYISFTKSLLNFQNETSKNHYFNCYEWKYNKGKLKFIEYSKENNQDFLEFIELIDRYIEQNESYRLE
jgi:hypothetical protein